MWLKGFIEGPSVASDGDEILFSSVCLLVAVLSSFFVVIFFVVLLVLFVIPAVLVEAVMRWVVCAFSIVLLTVVAAWVVCLLLVVCAWFVELLTEVVIPVASDGLPVVLVLAGVLANVVVFIVVCADGVVAFVVRKIVVVLIVVGGSKEEINSFLSSKAKLIFVTKRLCNTQSKIQSLTLQRF